MAVFEIRIVCQGCGKECRGAVSQGMEAPALYCSGCGRLLCKVRVIKGYVYVLSNPRMPGLLKVGCTTRPVEERVQELNGATGVPSPFVIEASFQSSAPEDHEREIHKRLAAHRVKGREFFQVGLGAVLGVAREVVQAHPTHRNGISEGIVSKVSDVSAETQTRWSCGLCKHVWVASGEPAMSRCPLCQSTCIVRLGG